MLGGLLALAGCLGAEPEVFVDAGKGAVLEASMRSALLQDFQEAGSRTESPAGPGWVLDPWAVVGRLFRLRLPHQEDVHLGDVQVRRHTRGHMTTSARHLTAPGAGANQTEGFSPLCPPSILTHLLLLLL